MPLNRKKLESLLSQKASGPNCALLNVISNTTCWWNNDTIYNNLLFRSVASCINDLLTIVMICVNGPWIQWVLITHGFNKVAFLDSIPSSVTCPVFWDLSPDSVAKPGTGRIQNDVFGAERHLFLPTDHVDNKQKDLKHLQYVHP